MFSVFFFPGSNFVATLTVGGAGAQASYYHKANDQVNSLVLIFHPTSADNRHFRILDIRCFLIGWYVLFVI